MNEDINKTNQKPKIKSWVIALIVIGSLIVLYGIMSWISKGVGGTLGYTELESSSSSFSSSDHSMPKSPSYDENKALTNSSNSIEGSSNEESTERMAVKDASLSMVVASVEDSGEKIVSYAEDNLGYVVNSQINNPLDKPRSYITVRVPADKLDQTIKYYKSLADKVVYEEVSSKDITEQYTDLASKLKNYEATEKQLQEIMKQASNVEEVLKVQKQLTSVRQNIEVTRGKMEYLEKDMYLWQ